MLVVNVQCILCKCIIQEGFLINYSWYFKNMPAQEKLMKEVGAEYFAVSAETLNI